MEDLDGNRLETGDKSVQCDTQLYLEGPTVENLLFANFTATPPPSEPKIKLCAPEYETQVLLTSFRIRNCHIVICTCISLSYLPQYPQQYAVHT